MVKKGTGLKDGELMLRWGLSSKKHPKYYPVKSIAHAIEKVCQLADKTIEMRHNGEIHIDSSFEYELKVFSGGEWVSYTNEYGDTIDEILGGEL